MLRVTEPYLNLLLERRIFLMFSGKNIILCICIKLYFFPEKKYMCLPYLNLFRPVTRNTHIFSFGLIIYKISIRQQRSPLAFKMVQVLLWPKHTIFQYFLNMRTYLINAHTDISSKANGFNFGLSHHLNPYSKTCVKRPLKKDKTKILMTNSSLMKVKAFQNGTFCNTFDLH